MLTGSPSVAAATEECLGDDEAAAYAQQLDDEASRARAEAHMDRCDVCRWLVSALVRSQATRAETAAALPRQLRPAPLDRYAPGEVLARGGQGRVRRGTDGWLGREVALKEP